MAETHARTANRAHEKKRVLNGVNDTNQEFGFVPSRTAVAIQSLVFTLAETSSAKFGAAWCVRNGEASVYHVYVGTLIYMIGLGTLEVIYSLCLPITMQMP